MLAIRFNLNAYTSFWNSPRAALYFWSALTVVAILIGLLVWRLGLRRR